MIFYSTPIGVEYPLKSVLSPIGVECLLKMGHSINIKLLRSFNCKQRSEFDLDFNAPPCLRRRQIFIATIRI
jgi:hypothetical protein